MKRFAEEVEGELSIRRDCVLVEVVGEYLVEILGIVFVVLIPIPYFDFSIHAVYVFFFFSLFVFGYLVVAESLCRQNVVVLLHITSNL